MSSKGTEQLNWTEGTERCWPRPFFFLIFIVVQSLNHVWLFMTPWTTAHQASLSFTISQSCLSSCPLSWWCHPTISSSVAPSPLPSIFPSNRVFFSESAVCIKWPRFWSFSFSVSPSNEYSGLISFRIEWFNVLALQGTLKSLLQHHSLKASVLWYSAFFMVQLTSVHDYWKNHSFN